MKKIIFILTLIVVAQLPTKAQQEKQFLAAVNYTTLKPMYSSGNNLPDKNYDYYMSKRKNNLTAGYVTLGAGVLFSGIGLIIATNSNASFDDAATGGVITAIGAACGIASIPCMIMATVYKHKAKMQLSTQKTAFGVPSGVSKEIVGITFKLGLGK